MGRPPIGKRAMTDAERKRKQREKFRDNNSVTKPAAPSADELAQAKATIRALQAELARKAAAEPPASGGTFRDSRYVTKLEARIRELEHELATAKMQLDMARHDLAEFTRANAPNPLVMSLQTEIKSLKGKLAREKAQAIPPSVREAKLREANKILAARLRAAANAPPRGTIIMNKRDKNKIRKCLHPDRRAALSQLSKQEQEAALNDALQIFNALRIREP